MKTLLIAMFSLVLASGLRSDDKTPQGERKGTVTGVLTAKDTKDFKWIEIKADGEEKARRYVAPWKGGAPKDGGGPDKGIVKLFKETPVESRVRIEWSFEERLRVNKLEVLKKDSSTKPEKR